MEDKNTTTAQKEFILDAINKAQDEKLIALIYQILVRIINTH